MVIARGFPPTSTSTSSTTTGIRAPAPSSRPGAAAATTSSSQQHPGVKAYIQAVGGTNSFSCPVDAAGSVFMREGSARLVGLAPSSITAAMAASGASGGGGSATRGAMSLTAVANRSSVVGLLAKTVEQANSIMEAGAYLHWYDKYGVSREALSSALQLVSDVADCYRTAHGIRD